MEKGAAPNVFANDGSFMQKFQQLEQEKQAKEVAAVRSDSGNSEIASTSNKRPYDSKINEKKPVTASNGKLAFSLKPKPKIVVAPVLLAADEDEDDNQRLKGHVHEPLKRLRTGPSIATSEFGGRADVAQVPTPSDPTVKNVADKLASFVAKHGRQFEDVTRQRNPGDTPFKFLFDLSSSDYKYYEYRLKEEEKAFAPSKDNHTSPTASIPPHASSSGQRGPTQPPPNYQIPTSALYDAEGEHSGAPSNDSIAMVEFYMKKAAAEERKRPLRRAKDEMPPPASLQAPPSKKGHHMGDYIPPEELEKFLSTCNDVAAQKAAKEAAERAKIQADNVGHRLLSKMGWKEGEGLGSSKSGRAEPVMAGNVKSNNLGVGAEQPGEVTPEDDIYEQYKKRMMLGYRYRPNPLNNPRKAYY